MRRFLRQGPVVQAVPGFTEVKRFVDGLFIQEGQNQHSPTVKRSAVLVVYHGRWKLAKRVMVAKKSERTLLNRYFRRDIDFAIPVPEHHVGKQQEHTRSH